MNLTLNIPEIPNDSIWFASRNAWKSYWAQAFVTLDVTAFDAATETTYGTVKKSATVSFTNSSIVPTYVSFIDMFGVTTYVVDKTTFDAFLAKVNTTATALDTLITNLKAAGILA